MKRVCTPRTSGPLTAAAGTGAAVLITVPCRLNGAGSDMAAFIASQLALTAVGGASGTANMTPQRNVMCDPDRHCKWVLVHHIKTALNSCKEHQHTCIVAGSRNAYAVHPSPAARRPCGPPHR